MSLFRLALANLGASPLSSAVNVLLLALGTASIAILLLASAQLSSTLTRNAAGIDLVIGAKGSPLQLVLAGVYHADVPPGNIPFAEGARWLEHPMVESAIPLSLGDSYGGYRIVGTVPAFPEIYNAELLEGDYWNAPLQAVIGSRVAETTGLSVGDMFEGVHGLSDDGDRHEESEYRVVGQFASTGSVIDGLIVTSLESVWLMHDSHAQGDHAATEGAAGEDDHDTAEEHPHDKDDHDTAEEHPHDEDEHDTGEEHHHDEDEHETAEEHHHHNDDPHADEEITLLLIKLSSPLGMLSLPREVNEETALQAASPAFEVTRLLQIVGVGLNWLNAFASILVISAALSIFAALYSSLRARRHGLAVLRCLGATRWELFYLLFVEGLVLTVSGIVFGLLLAHGGIELVGQWLGDEQGIVVSGWTWTAGEFVLVAGLLVVGSITALLPAWQAYSTDVARTLSAP